MIDPAVRAALLAAASLIEPEGAWTQGEFARDADGRSRPSCDPRATCRCASGALLAVCGGSGPEYWAARNVLDLHIASISKYVTVMAWQDTRARKQADVVAAMRAAAGGV